MNVRDDLNARPASSPDNFFKGNLVDLQAELSKEKEGSTSHDNFDQCITGEGVAVLCFTTVNLLYNGMINGKKVTFLLHSESQLSGSVSKKLVNSHY